MGYCGTVVVMMVVQIIGLTSGCLSGEHKRSIGRIGGGAVDDHCGGTVGMWYHTTVSLTYNLPETQNMDESVLSVRQT